MINEDFYQIYKSGRDLVKEFYGKTTDKICTDFINIQKAITENYDKKNPDCKNRWLKEKNE